MYPRQFAFAIGFAAALAFSLPELVSGAIISSGDAVGTTGYHVASVDAGVTLDFTGPTTGTTANSFTVGVITVTLSHTNLNPLGFSLVEETPGGLQDFRAAQGLRLLLNVVDTNGMILPWVGYNITANDTSTVPNPGTEDAHLSLAHFHNTNSAFGSNPLVLQGDGDNVKQLNFGLGSSVSSGDKFTASNILLHERDYADVSRSFNIQLAPVISPEPSSFVLFCGLGAAFVWVRRRKPNSRALLITGRSAA
jgi:hypothetical protein